MGPNPQQILKDFELHELKRLTGVKMGNHFFLGRTATIIPFQFQVDKYELILDINALNNN